VGLGCVVVEVVLVGSAYLFSPAGRSSVEKHFIVRSRRRGSALSGGFWHVAPIHPGNAILAREVEVGPTDPPYNGSLA
jgi:hypothetical protein